MPFRKGELSRSPVVASRRKPSAGRMPHNISALMAVMAMNADHRPRFSEWLIGSISPSPSTSTGSLKRRATKRSVTHQPIAVTKKVDAIMKYQLAAGLTV